MPGVPGAGGPVPKRSSQRRRMNKPLTPVTKAPSGRRPLVPPADDAWHPIARDWYDSLALSGQSAFYESSDWAHARYVAEAMSRSLGTTFSAALFAAVMSATTSLLTTEGDRRRLRIELERGAGDPDRDKALAAVADIRARVTG